MCPEITKQDDQELLQIRQAHWIWCKMSGAFDRDLDLSLEFLRMDSPTQPSEGWVRRCREGLLLSQKEVSSRLKISQQAYGKLEKCDSQNGLQIETLKKVALAMDCELVHYLRPRERKNFSSLQWENILPRILSNYRKISHTKIIRPLIFANLALKVSRDCRVRRELKWTRNKLDESASD